MAKIEIHTYHCLCTELLLATSCPLTLLPRRQVDHAAICKISPTDDNLIPGGANLSGSTFDEAVPTVLKLEDGFEKRYAVRCKRCDLQFGYWLDKSQFEPEEKGRRDDVLYLLPGGLLNTEEMKEGKDMAEEIEVVRKAGG